MDMGVSGYLFDSAVGSSWVCWPGVARRLLTFFASPKKVSKERRPLLSASLRCATGNRRCSAKTGSRANSPAAQTSTSPDPFWLALLGAYRRGDPDSDSDSDSDSDAGSSSGSGSGSWSPIPIPTRPGWACAAQGKRDQGERLSERSEFVPGPRFSQAAQGVIGALTPITRTQTAGRLSFAYFSLAKQRTSESPPGDSRPANLRRAKKTIK